MDTGLIDLSQVVAMVASFGPTAGFISMVRVLFLDRALTGLSSEQRNYAYQALNVVVNFALILAASLLVAHEAFGPRLLVSVAVAAWLAATGSHFTYRASIKTKTGGAALEPSYPEIPSSESGEPDPEPPSDDPAALALAA